MGAMIAALGAQLAGEAASAGLGGLMGIINDKRQLKQQGKLQDLQLQGNQIALDQQSAKEMAMWKATNYSAQVSELEKAGLNPALLYGMSGGGGTTTGGGGAPVTGGQAPQGGGEVMGMMQMGMQFQLLKAQKENIEADTLVKLKNAPNIEADTENKILNKIILEYTGKEAKSMYEEVNQPNRDMMARAKTDELSGIQAIGQTINEMFITGKLRDKSLQEIEQSLLQNAKTREEIKQITKNIDLLEQNIKGANLDNIIKDLETKLQTTTGIDRNSPTWMKVIGRLLIQLMSQ